VLPASSSIKPLLTHAHCFSGTSPLNETKREVKNLDPGLLNELMRNKKLDEFKKLFQEDADYSVDLSKDSVGSLVQTSMWSSLTRYWELLLRYINKENKEKLLETTDRWGNKPLTHALRDSNPTLASHLLSIYTQKPPTTSELIAQTRTPPTPSQTLSSFMDKPVWRSRATLIQSEREQQVAELVKLLPEPRHQLSLSHFLLGAQVTAHKALAAKIARDSVQSLEKIITQLQSADTKAAEQKNLALELQKHFYRLGHALNEGLDDPATIVTVVKFLDANPSLLSIQKPVTAT
jgi:hypothetical protein